MVYYARSENKQKVKETVTHHLERCGELAEKFASKFGCVVAGLMIGRFHDIGKYSENFQKVLTHDEFGINHSAAGACFLWIKGKQKKASIYYLLAVAVYAHHGKLEYFIDDVLERSFRENDSDDGTKRFAISGQEQYQECKKIIEKENIIPNGKPEYKDFTKYMKPELGKMLYIRMLYSCLVDADYSSSAEHFNCNYLLDSALPNIDFGQVTANLESYRNNIRLNSTSDKNINKLRDIVYEDCKKGAKHEPGVFTLTAPTGSGKTLALLKFALEHAIEYHKERIIIVLPFLSIIEQNAAQYKDICNYILEAHSSVEYTGKNPALAKELSSRWAANIIITTSVCFFETLFRNSPADLRKLHTYSNSVIVFDEAQSLPGHLVGASLDAINGLCRDYNSTVLFSTATQPNFDYRKDVCWKPWEISHNIAELFLMARRTKTEWRLNKKQSFEDTAKEMSNYHSCCTIVNKKDHAAKLFELLDKINNNTFYISTNLCQSHRKKVLKDINDRLRSKQECRIVATQCIEAGVDLDVDVVFRTLAPLDSIVQSAGRCNRGGRLKFGKVIVFIPDEEGKLYPSSDYEMAANVVKLLLERHGGEIDIHNPDIIDEYYRQLYSDKGAGSDKLELVQAIDEMNFEQVSQQYQLINNTGYNIIVPYEDEISLYDSICEKARSDGLTQKLMLEARKITVSSYDIESILEKCEPIYIHSKYGKEKSTWYLLGDRELYNKNTGLDLKSENGFSYIS